MPVLKKGKLFLVDHVHLSSSVEKEIFFPKVIFRLILKSTYFFANKIVVVSNGVKRDILQISSKLKKKIKVFIIHLLKPKHSKLKIKRL